MQMSLFEVLQSQERVVLYAGYALPGAHVLRPLLFAAEPEQGKPYRELDWKTLPEVAKDLVSGAELLLTPEEERRVSGIGLLGTSVDMPFLAEWRNMEWVRGLPEP